ncbi:MAG: hypothetical protein LC126_08660 [Bryobacterales bacterium]|nr:hypothetical protein [Bryobacterales bacterium]
MTAEPEPFLLRNERAEAYRTLRDQYLQRFQPSDSVERDLVLHLAVTTWRLHRLQSIEAGLYEAAMQDCRDVMEEEFTSLTPEAQRGAAYQCLSSKSDVLKDLRRFEAHLRRVYQNTLRCLIDLRNPRSAPLPPAAARRPFLIVDNVHDKAA